MHAAGEGVIVHSGDAQFSASGTDAFQKGIVNVDVFRRQSFIDELVKDFG